MKFLFKDSNDKLSASKSIYIIMSIACLIKVIIGGMAYGDFSIKAPDYGGMAALIVALGAVYYGRAKTIAEANAK